MTHTPPPDPTSDARWNAVLQRDARHDGAFLYGVRTTRIYCRPSCPARRPKREHVTFYDDAAGAERAGFRPCLRCRPTEVGTRLRVVLHAQHLLDTLEPTPTLTELARAVDLSPSHLQRVFKAATGVSPKGYAIARRAERLKRHLRDGASVTTALYDAGHANPRTLYDPSTDQLGMTPGRYKAGGAGETITFTVTPSALGPMLVAATPRGLVAVRFGHADALEAELRTEYPNATLECNEPALREYTRALHGHLAGTHRDLHLPHDAPGTAFQQRVWNALRAIPYGETRTYTQLAESIGEPTAVRAVARACATNPTALVIPCHRILRKNGELSGYRWGVQRKRELLERESANAAQEESHG